jgi:hypothetical protein
MRNFTAEEQQRIRRGHCRTTDAGDRTMLVGGRRYAEIEIAGMGVSWSCIQRFLFKTLGQPSIHNYSASWRGTGIYPLLISGCKEN